MKTASFPALRITPKFRQTAEQVLQEGETLPSFVEKSIRENIARRQPRSEFVARGLASREHARETGRQVSTDAVLGRLEKNAGQRKGRQVTYRVRFTEEPAGRPIQTDWHSSHLRLHPERQQWTAHLTYWAIPWNEHSTHMAHFVLAM